MKISIRQLCWHARRQMIAFGWPGGLAILILLLCGVFNFLVLQPTQNHIVALQKDIASLRDQTKSRPFPKQKELNQAEQLVAFYRFFPAEKTASDWIGKIYNAAAQQNLNIDQGEYHLVPEKNSKLIRYDIVLPLKGGYVQIRKFMAQALRDIPNLSLDKVSFSRSKIDETMVDAQLRFSLYLDEN